MKIQLNNLQESYFFKADIFKSEKCSVDTMELKGYKLIKELFVDNSGLGGSNELALTPYQFLKEMKNIVSKHYVVYTTITKQGQFQVYIGVFTKNGKRKTKKIANNTMRITYPDGSEAIRLHDTNIITFNNDQTITLDSGGFRTLTTKRRINEFLPKGRIYQKNYDWYYTNDGETIDFIDGMILK